MAPIDPISGRAASRDGAGSDLRPRVVREPRESQHVPAEFSIGFLGTALDLRVRAAAVELEIPDAAIVRLPLKHVRDAHDRNLVSAFASACSLVFVEMDGGSTSTALPAIIRTGTSAIADLPSGLSLSELRNIRKLCEEAQACVGVSRPMRFQKELSSLIGRGRADLVWADLHVRPSVPKAIVLGDLIDAIVMLVGGRSVQRIDSKSSVDASGQGETLGITVRFQNSALAMIRVRVDEAADLESSSIRVSGSWGEDQAQLRVRPYSESAIASETAAFVRKFVTESTVPSTLEDALEVTRIVELIMVRLRQHDRLAV